MAGCDAAIPGLRADKSNWGNAGGGMSETKQTDGRQLKAGGDHLAEIYGGPLIAQ